MPRIFKRVYEDVAAWSRTRETGRGSCMLISSVQTLQWNMVQSWLRNNAGGTDPVLFIDSTIWMNYEAYTSSALDVSSPCRGGNGKKNNNNMLLKQLQGFFFYNKWHWPCGSSDLDVNAECRTEEQKKRSSKLNKWIWLNCRFGKEKGAQYRAA